MEAVGLRDFNHATSPNADTVKPGFVVLINDDTPCINWRLVVVEDTIAGEDGLVRAANIRTSTGRTNHPIIKLYPLEVTAKDPLYREHPSKLNLSDNDNMTDDQTEQPDTTLKQRPTRKAALKGRQRVNEWTKSLSGPPEDEEN